MSRNTLGTSGAQGSRVERPVIRGMTMAALVSLVVLLGRWNTTLVATSGLVAGEGLRTTLTDYSARPIGVQVVVLHAAW